MLKVLGGILKGFNLTFPKDNEDIRPTLVLLKRRIFDSIQRFNGQVFVDICAGTGSIGLEAWSRGAKELYLVETSKTALKFLKSNVLKAEIKDPTRPINLVSRDIKKWLPVFLQGYKNWENEDKENCILYFDPPYHKKDLYTFFRTNILDSKEYFGMVWIEASNDVISSTFWEENYPSLDIKIFTQGTSYIAIFNL